MGTFIALAAQFDPTNIKRKGDQFELVCKWFLENDPTYQPLLRRVWLWDNWPGRKGNDAGIDLVAEDHDRKLWAIQAKAYDPSYSISKRDIDKFVAESSRKIFTHRLLIGTTDKRHHIATRLMDDLGIPFIGLTKLREADDYLDWPATPEALKPSKPAKTKKPHDYQKTAITDVVKGFKSADRGQLIMACGTGKTLTAWFITEKLAAERTLVLVPSLSLLKQTMREWQTANPKKPFAALPVCSDETVGSLGEDAAVSHTSDLGVPVTTDPEVIAEFLRKRSGPRVVFSTYQSSPQIAEAFKLGRVPAFDVVIADEAHRVAGPVSSDFGTVLDPAAIKAKRRLFMTATPRYFTGRVLRAAKDADYEVASMDDTAKFGEVFHRLTFGEAIERKLLTDYQVAIIGVDDATYLDWAQRGEPITLDGKKAVSASSLAGQIGLAKAMRKFDLRRMITFHGRVKAAKDFAASMPAVLEWMPPRERPRGSLWSKYASGEMSAGERGVLIQHLKYLDDGERGLLANARCLAEGVDVPALDGVAFIDPRRSEVDIVQAVGRAIRKTDDKNIGTIVIPVFIDTEQDAETALDSSLFKPVWDVIKALRAHDTELGEQLDSLRREMGRKGGKPRLPGKIHVNVPATAGADFVDAFNVRLVEATTAPWEFMFGLLEMYVAELGDARVSAKVRYNGYGLGGWAVMQRSNYRQGTLDPDRAARLERLPGWTWDPRSEQWEEAFQLLLQYVHEFKTSILPNEYSVNGINLWQWAKNVRRRRDEISVERQHQLEALPDWMWDLRDEMWERSFRLLSEYAEQHGSCRLPEGYTVSGVSLHTWAGTQRVVYAKGNLTEDRQQRLESLPGWSWNLMDEAWERSYAELEAYVAEHGSALAPPRSPSASGINLGVWVTIQRKSYANGNLDEQRQRRLEKLPGWSWDRLADAWEKAFSLVEDYAKKHGHARVPQTERASNVNLGSWVSGQRVKYARGQLSDEEQRRLEALPGWEWDARNAKWDSVYEFVVKYAKDHGTCRVPPGPMVDGVSVRNWVVTQRRFRVKGMLAEDRQRRLEMLPGWTWDLADDAWEKAFLLLEQYVQENGDARIKQDRKVNGFRLGSWVSIQRGKYAKGNLSDDRKYRLESLPGWSWDIRTDAWEKAFSLLKAYVEEHGHARVEYSYEADGVSVGAWASLQRSLFAKASLSVDRVDRLEALPGWDWRPPPGPRR